MLYTRHVYSFLIQSRKISGGRKGDAFQASSVIRETEKSEKISTSEDSLVVAEHERLSLMHGSECGLSLGWPRRELWRHVVLPIRRLSDPPSVPSWSSLVRSLIVTTTPHYVSSINRREAGEGRRFR
jgi:hypothetical protein